jgi:O-antigen ligase
MNSPALPTTARGLPLPALWAGGVLALAVLGLALQRPGWTGEHAGPLALAVLAPMGLLAWLSSARQGGVALAALGFVVVLLADVSLRPSEAEGADLQSMAKLASWLLGLALLALQPAAALALLRRMPPALAAWAGIGLLGLVTAPWSATPAYSAAAALGWLGLAALALLMAERLRLVQALAALVLALALLVGGSLLRGLLDPAAALSAMDGGAHLRLAGWFASPNNLGRAAALLLLLGGLLGWRLGGARGLLVVLVAGLVGAAALLQSESRGALLALLAALAWCALARRPALALLVAALGLAAVLAVAALPWWANDLAQAVSRSGRIEEVLSFTGRTDIWAASWQLVTEAPWIGHGFASSREVLPQAWQGAHGWTTTSAHHLVLQLALGGGALAVLLLMLALAAWWRQLRREGVAARPERDAVVVFVLALGLLEASAAGPSVNLLTFLLAWALALQRSGRV